MPPPEHATSDTEAVLDGDFDDFVATYLRWRRIQELAAESESAH